MLCDIILYVFSVTQWWLHLQQNKKKLGAEKTEMYFFLWSRNLILRSNSCHLIGQKFFVVIWSYLVSSYCEQRKFAFFNPFFVYFCVFSFFFCKVLLITFMASSKLGKATVIQPQTEVSCFLFKVHSSHLRNCLHDMIALQSLYRQRHFAVVQGSIRDWCLSKQETHRQQTSSAWQ